MSASAGLQCTVGATATAWHHNSHTTRTATATEGAAAFACAARLQQLHPATATRCCQPRAAATVRKPSSFRRQHPSRTDSGQKRIVVTTGNGGPRPPRPVRPIPGAAAADSDEQPRTIAQITPAGGEKGSASTAAVPWRPQKVWKPAGPQDATRLPYSQPWFRQGQTALDSCVKELREMRALVEVRTTERDHALNMAQEANEMWSRIKADNANMQRDVEAAQQRAEAEAANAEASARDAAQAHRDCQQLRVEMSKQAAELEAANKATEEARKEMEACKAALREMASKEAAEHARMRRAEAELAAATELQMRMEAQRAAEAAAAKQAEVEMQAQEEARVAAARAGRRSRGCAI